MIMVMLEFRSWAYPLILGLLPLGSTHCIVTPGPSTEPGPPSAECPACPEPVETFVKLDGGEFSLTLPASLGGVVVQGEQAPFGAYRRRWNGHEFTVHDVWLALPSVALPIPGQEQTGPIVIREALGSFDPEQTEGLGEPNHGHFDPESGVLVETLGLSVELPSFGPEASTRVLLRKVEEGYDPEHGASLSFTGEGVITEGPLAGSSLQFQSRTGKGADYTFEVCTPQRISTGYATFVEKNGCRVTPAARATCRASSLSNTGGVLVHCKSPGLATVAITYNDGRGTHRATRTVRCK